ncbi:hypothetical protein AXG93_3846s1030 [Marchantia polymorpha subsp. ruderalis]|uniref:Protein kinase domain-containing protein n=1 Tax=Marchantia polymorpha subsp. ruderalis TaxID=1480154 RepID=A0A176VLZ6_MARPO|nr:hypothetical protein AXG93_3846s1030 [Marchantia polymorpha subsp. ruderalis]
MNAGQLNIDCGHLKNYSDYYFNWVTDTGYISTGYTSGQVWASGQWTDFRFFNDTRKKHCYTLPTLPDTTYLVRASFLYGNFSELYGNVSFDLTINSTYWTTINIAPVVDWYAENLGVEVILRRDVIVRSSGTSLFLCLVRKMGLPFITSIQLRKLADNMYEETKQDQILAVEARWAASSYDEVRFPDDPYDRIWQAVDTNTGVSSDQPVDVYGRHDQNLKIENTTEIPTSSGINRPPSKVMQNAYMWNETTDFAWFYLTNLSDLSGQYYTALYFQEIDELANATSTSGSRTISVSLDGVDSVAKDITVTSEVSMLTAVFETTDTSFNFTFTKDADSNLPPMVNALELYSVYAVDPLAFTAPEDVVALRYLQQSLSGIGNWNGDPCFPQPWDWLTCNSGRPARVVKVRLSNMWLKGTITPNITGLTALTDLWLDRNFIGGYLPDPVGMLSLRTIHVQNNSLIGSIPFGFSILPELQELLVQNNNLSGPIPPGLLAPRNGVNFSFVYDGNEFLSKCLPENGPCLPNSSPSGIGPPGADSDRKKAGMSAALIVGAVAGGVGVVLALFFFYCCCLKKTPHADLDKGLGAVGMLKADKDGSQQLQARAFNLAEITTITHNFVRKLGQGSFGPVFYGKLPDGTEVAVKVNAADSSQGTEEFVNEVVLLSRVHHKYLVSLVGYCEAPQQHILVYAFMPNGTLTEHLHGDKAKTEPLTWMERLEIALNSAQGLEYLHAFCNPPIIHRDIKPSNILLDNNLMAKVADFGMSKSAPEDSRTGFSTAVKGTLGYLDPEYLSGWRLTTKSDVYSFGIILLELITGRKPTSVIHFADGTQGNFMGWAKSAQRSGDIHSIVDPDLEGKFNTEAMWKVAEMAWASVEAQGTSRPDMGEIVRGLKEAIALENSDISSKVPGQHDLSYSSSRASYSSSAPLKSQPSYSSISTWDADMAQHHQPR